MKIVLFCHSLASCWNHGNAHFLRGVARELAAAGHEVRVFEPADGWSRANLLRDHGTAALGGWQAAYPELSSTTYEGLPNLDLALDGADLVLVHEWNPPALVAALGRARRRGGRFLLLFHDTHHRAASRPDEIAAFPLDGYDAVLAFGEVLRERYLAAGWARRVWVWHEAADTRLFRPLPGTPSEGDLVWIGNWGDGERTDELRQFLVEPAAALGLRTNVYGVRYPEEARTELAAAGIAYRGWLPNHAAPRRFAAHRVTVHVPRRPYVAALPGIPTIRVFEALACGIPLVCAPWRDSEGLFPAGSFLIAEDGAAMRRQLEVVLGDRDLRASLIATGLAAIAARHTCAHRAAELLAIHAQLAGTGPDKETLRPCA